MRRILRTFAPLSAALAIGSLTTGCDREIVENPPQVPVAIVDAETRFPVSLDGKPIPMRLRLTELELATGLMNTPVFADGEGMIFIQKDAARRAFWMANVPYDIDIAHFDADGVLVESHRLHALDTTPVATESERIRYSLELPAGHLERHGIRPGAKLDLDALGAAIAARGFRRQNFIGVLAEPTGAGARP